MAVQTTYPGVYIEEFAPGAPIQGVGTSTAAFVGVATRGTPNEPRRITSWDAFRRNFGEQPVPGFYLWYAVRGFYENGGQVCYVVRATNGRSDTWQLQNAAAANLFNVRTREVGATGTVLAIVAVDRLLQARAGQASAVAGNTLTIGVGEGANFEIGDVIAVAGAGERPYVTAITPNAAGDRLTTSVNVTNPGGFPRAVTVVGARVFRPATQATAVAGRNITVTAGTGLNFIPGDELTIAGTTARPIVSRVVPVVGGGPGDVITVDRDVLPVPAALPAALRLADTQPGARTVRVQLGANIIPRDLLVPGAMISLQVVGGGPAGSTTQILQSISVNTVPMGHAVASLMFREGMQIPLSMDPATAVIDVNAVEFTIRVTRGGATRDYLNLAADPTHPRYVVDYFQDDTRPIIVEPVEPTPPVQPPNNSPTQVSAITAGAAENLAGMLDIHFTTALDTLRRIDPINLVACPDRNTIGVQDAIRVLCEQTGDRFGVLASPPATTLDQIETFRNGLDSPRGYAALYYPWIQVPTAIGDTQIFVPPTGHACGIIARSDRMVGVHKAPANEPVNGAFAVQQPMSDVEQGLINMRGINAIRVFSEGGRLTLFGARTTATDTNWQYVNIRRLFLYLEESIEEGIRYAIFSPNNLALWQKLRRSINAFLRQAWRDGMLFGARERDAWYCRIDEDLNPFSEQQLGRLHIEIGVRPTFPAEFVIVRIGIWDGGSEIQEG